MQRAASRIGERLPDTFRAKDSLKQGTALLSLLFGLAVEHAIREVQENRNDWHWMEHISYGQMLMKFGVEGFTRCDTVMWIDALADSTCECTHERNCLDSINSLLQIKRDNSLRSVSALKEYFNVHNKTNKWTCRPIKYVLSHNINHQRVSITFVTATIRAALQQQ